MTREIKDRSLRRLLAKAGLETVHLYKDDGFFFICSDDDTCDACNSRAIYVNDFCQMTPKQWLEEIQLLLEDND